MDPLLYAIPASGITELERRRETTEPTHQVNENMSQTQSSNSNGSQNNQFQHSQTEQRARQPFDGSHLPTRLMTEDYLPAITDFPVAAGMSCPPGENKHKTKQDKRIIRKNISD